MKHSLVYYLPCGKVFQGSLLLTLVKERFLLSKDKSCDLRPSECKSLLNPQNALVLECQHCILPSLTVSKLRAGGRRIGTAAGNAIVELLAMALQLFGALYVHLFLIYPLSNYSALWSPRSNPLKLRQVEPWNSTPSRIPFLAVSSRLELSKFAPGQPESSRLG